MAGQAGRQAQVGIFEIHFHWNCFIGRIGVDIFRRSAEEWTGKRRNNVTGAPSLRETEFQSLVLFGVSKWQYNNNTTFLIIEILFQEKNTMALSQRFGKTFY